MQTRILANIGTAIAIVGFLTLTLVIFGISIPGAPAFADFYGPLAALMFGWLLIVPEVYSGIGLRGYLSLVVFYVLTYMGMTILISGDRTVTIILLYAGMGALAWAAKYRPQAQIHGAPLATSWLFANNKAQACAADTLFGITALLVLILAYFTLIGQTLAMGLVGQGVEKIFTIVAELTNGWAFAQKVVNFVAENLQAEYYIYAVASLFWLASKQTPAQRHIPPKIAAFIVAAIGLFTLLGGLYLIFIGPADDLIALFLNLCICGLGVFIAYLGLRQAGP